MLNVAGSSSCSLHDGLELVTRGVTTAVLCTERFQATAQAICAVRSQPFYCFVVLEHPIGSLTDEEVLGRARVAGGLVAALLTVG